MAIIIHGDTGVAIIIHGDTGVAVYMGIQEWLYTWGYRSGCIHGDT